MDLSHRCCFSLVEMLCEENLPEKYSHPSHRRGITVPVRTPVLVERKIGRSDRVRFGISSRQSRTLTTRPSLDGVSDRLARTTPTMGFLSSNRTQSQQHVECSSTVNSRSMRRAQQSAFVWLRRVLVERVARIACPARVIVRV